MYVYIFARVIISSSFLGNAVLDLGTGTADVAIEVARNLKKKMGGGALATDAVVGVDPRCASVRLRVREDVCVCVCCVCVCVCVGIACVGVRAQRCVCVRGEKEHVEVRGDVCV